MDALAQIARTVLYEGYVLWPYRRSAVKNQQRWTFGGIYPTAFAAISGGADRSTVRTECLIEAEPGARVDVTLRFLHVVSRQAVRVDGETRTPVSELHVGGERFLSWDEATEREIRCSLELSGAPDSMALPIVVESGVVEERLVDASGAVEGLIVRRWERLDGTLMAVATPVVGCASRNVHRVAVTVANTAPWHGTASDRPDVVRHTLVSAHIVLQTDRGAFVSSVDPETVLESEVRTCSNDGLWPVLVGEQGARDTVLAAPIILGDYPRIAPESPGDLFDGGEIDQLLILNILTLTDEEQREMRDSDPRAREVLERCQGLTEDDLMRLHGTVRSLDAFALAPEPLR